MTVLDPHAPWPIVLPGKLFPAGLDSPALLPREALVEQLLHNRRRPLLLVSAPAGYGKSTLLALLRRRLMQAGETVAWLTCDEADAEPRRLLAYLLAALQRAVPEFGGRTAALLRESLPRPWTS